MSLHGAVNVNGQQVGAWSATRTSPHGQPQPDDVCEYEWSWVGNEDPKPLRGTVRHRYGNGAASLASEVLRVAARAARLGYTP